MTRPDLLDMSGSNTLFLRCHQFWVVVVFAARFEGIHAWTVVHPDESSLFVKVLMSIIADLVVFSSGANKSR